MLEYGAWAGVWAAVGSIITLLIKWIPFKWVASRDTEKRKEEAKAKDMEMETLRKQVDWMQKKYEGVSRKLDDLYEKFRNLEEEKVKLIMENKNLELALKIAEYNKCERPDDDCIRRIPQRQKCRLKMLLNGTYDELTKDDENDIFEVRTIVDKS